MYEHFVKKIPLNRLGGVSRKLINQRRVISQCNSRHSQGKEETAKDRNISDTDLKVLSRCHCHQAGLGGRTYSHNKFASDQRMVTDVSSCMTGSNRDKQETQSAKGTGDIVKNDFVNVVACDLE